CERVIRTLKECLYRSFSLRGTYKWIDNLENITKDYNNRKHRTIGMKPNEVNEKNQQFILNSCFNYSELSSKRSYKVGDFVRISKQKYAFSKNYTPNWSTELFKIAKVKVTNPITYLLEDLKGQPIKGC